MLVVEPLRRDTWDSGLTDDEPLRLCEPELTEPVPRPVELPLTVDELRLPDRTEELEEEELPLETELRVPEEREDEELELR